MLKNPDKKHIMAHFGANLLVVRGRRFSNTAAKFWSALIDELMTEHADCRHIHSEASPRHDASPRSDASERAELAERVALEAVNEGRLDPELLFPEVGLQRELNFLSDNADNINEIWRKALADFELYGPPGSVGLRVYSSSGERARLILPMDCVDAEIFLYLLVWLLEWSDVPLSAWNEPKIKGAFSAADPVRKFKYLFDFVIARVPLSEGLFSWRLDLKFERSNHAPVIPAKAGIQSGFSLDSHFHGNDTR